MLCLQTRLQNLEMRRQTLFSTVHTYSLLMNLKNFVCNIGEDAELLMSLYDPDQSEFIRSADPVCPQQGRYFCSVEEFGTRPAERRNVAKFVDEWTLCQDFSGLNIH